MALPEIPDELLVEILLRLPTASDLIRATAACVSFRHLVVDRCFLQRFRRLHPPPLLGFLDQHGFHPALPPHPSAPAARAVASTADFSFAFLPSPARSWSVRDVRDGRVLLDRPRRHGSGKGRNGALFAEMAVCDPLHREYLLLPPIPDDLAASDENPLRIYGQRWGESFLVPDGDDEETPPAEDTAFRVICLAQYQTKLVAFVFFSGTGQWRDIPSLSWINFIPDFSSEWMGISSWRQYAYGCFYWFAGWSGKFAVLDTRRMEFTMADRPPRVSGFHSYMGIVEAGEGMIGMFVPAHDKVGHHGHDTVLLRYTVRRSNGGSSTQWQTEKTISIASGSSFMGSIGRHLLLYQCGNSLLELGCFTLDVKTFQLERVCISRLIPAESRAYCNFPPSLLSSPKVSSGKLSLGC
ncbi:hypothetical protein CFC21_026454 [Triticum aestivum]|uniref:F-box domain-containing protein n=2 Tax=Triticum aestivum TaxID=4565 RepID=A0A9R1JCA2_WHEAT|nr:uncharacterized protein LOC123039642 [Triticum aestivum]KAF7012245.1 hypothetical protein CFC21_026454 [Triticum aestivum]